MFCLSHSAFALSVTICTMFQRPVVAHGDSETPPVVIKKSPYGVSFCIILILFIDAGSFAHPCMFSGIKESRQKKTTRQ